MNYQELWGEARRSIFIVCLLILASACGPGNISPLSDLEKGLTELELYRVRAGDALNISVWGEPKLSGDFYVREDGRITMPLIKDVVAVGKTLDELASDVETKLKDFVSGPQVAVTVTQEAPTRYYLSGSFSKPGEYRSANRISFLQAVAAGGGFAPFANQGRVMLIRKAAAGELRYELDYKAVVNGRQPNPSLQDGDVLAVD